MTNVVYASYGLGGAAVEVWNTGLRLFVERCQKIGLDTRKSPYNWNDINTILADIRTLPSTAKIAVGGASLGDDEATDIAVHTPKTIHYLYGFQCSTYAKWYGIPITVRAADNIYNPNWWETWGLGSGQWFLAPGNKITTLRNIPIRAPHPDDWGVAQDIVFSQIHKILGG